MSDLQALAEAEHEDPEYIPTILPVDARLAVRGPVSLLQTLFARAGAVTPTKEIIPGTAYVRIEAFSGSGSLPYLQVSATDGDLTLAMVADGVEVVMPGSALLPGKKISEILKLAPTKTASIEVLGNTATVRSGRAQWVVQTPVGDALPPAADVSGITTLPVSRTALLKALSVARKAASTSSARASLKQLAVSHGAVTGLDGGRLHRQRLDDLPQTLRLTIPVRVCDEVVSLLGSTDSEMVEMGGNDSHLVFRVDQDSIIAQRALIPFPDVESQIMAPALTNIHTLVVDRVALEESVRRVRVNADPDYQALFLTLAPLKTVDGVTQWGLTVSAQDRTGNSARETLEVQWSGSSGSRSLSVNHRSLSDLLSVLEGEHVVFKVGDDTKTTRLPLFVESTVSGFTGYVSQIRPGYLT